MKVELLNPDMLKNLYKNWGFFACECYDTPKKFAERVGKSCFDSTHFSGSRGEYIKFEITADRGTLEQCMRHSVGIKYEPDNTYIIQDFDDYIDMENRIPSNEMVNNMKSFRYCDMTDFNYSIPINIQNNPIALHAYKECMSQINEARTKIRNALIDNGITERKAVEDSNFTLPRATETVLCIGFTPEALLNFMWKRLCTRAQDEIHAIAVEMKKKVAEVNPQFAENLVPSCGHFLYCVEGNKTCGAAPTKTQLKAQLDHLKNNNQGIYHKNPELIENLI